MRPNLGPCLLDYNLIQKAGHRHILPLYEIYSSSVCVCVCGGGGVGGGGSGAVPNDFYGCSLATKAAVKHLHV